MAVNDFYVSTGYPIFNSFGDSASARAEFNLVNTGFDKLPTLSGFALKIIRVNAAGNALESVSLSTAKILASDGSVAATANIPLGGFKITGLGAASANGESVRFEQVGILASSQLPINSIDDTHIDWGTGTSQVSAADIPNTPSGNIAAVDVQAAINELDTEKATDTSVVHITATESVTGQKTFTAPLATADATAALGLATKQQVIEKTSATGSAIIASGTTAQRDGTPAVGYQRWNTTLAAMEVWGGGGAWSTLGGGALDMPVLTKTAAYTVVAGDKGKIIDCTNTFTITELAAAAAGNGFLMAYRNSGTGVITLSVSGIKLYANEAVLLTSNGTVWKRVADSPNPLSICTAWASFNNAPTIGNNLNVSGITISGGFAVVFATAMLNTNYTINANADFIPNADIRERHRIINKTVTGFTYTPVANNLFFSTDWQNISIVCFGGR